MKYIEIVEGIARFTKSGLTDDDDLEMLKNISNEEYEEAVKNHDQLKEYYFRKDENGVVIL